MEKGTVTMERTRSTVVGELMHSCYFGNYFVPKHSYHLTVALGAYSNGIEKVTIV